MFVNFENWVGGRQIEVLATNAGADIIAFQNWKKFKEAFAPEIVNRAIQESKVSVKRCLDPFGGSGTTALACQFLNVHPTTIEVNPYLADLIEAKICTYDASSLAADLGWVFKKANLYRPNLEKMFSNSPPTLFEPGVKGRWIFNRDIAERIACYLKAIDTLASKNNARLFRVLLGGILIDVSNVKVSGKGRRYRKNWMDNNLSIGQLDGIFLSAIESALQDIIQHGERKQLEYTLLRGDCRKSISKSDSVDLVLFSPPYPNSFDYTDVYNVELWMLGYLNDFQSSRDLRKSTLVSHVQVSRTFDLPPDGSKTLQKTMVEIEKVKDQLWNKRLVGMIGGYFFDMLSVMTACSEKLVSKGEIWMVVGDSKYAGVPIPVAQILKELAPLANCTVKKVESLRSMRASAQQGGKKELAESLIVLSKN